MASVLMEASLLFLNYCKKQVIRQQWLVSGILAVIPLDLITGIFCPDKAIIIIPILMKWEKKKPVEGYVTNLVTDAGINWLEKRDKEKPFCMLLHHKAPHRCWMPDTAYLDMYNDVKFPIPAIFYDNFEGQEAAKAQKMHLW